MRRWLRKNWLNLLTLIITLILLLPYLWLLMGAFKPINETFAVPPHFLPKRPTLDNFMEVLSRGRIQRFFLNSTIVAGSAVLINVMFASMAAFALSTFRFRGRQVLVVMTLGTQLFPAVITLIALYHLWGSLGLLNTYQALIATYVAYTLPLAVWMLTGYMRTTPYEIIEAAIVDGCRRFGLFRHIVLPLSLPGLAATMVYILLVCWNEFIFAVTLTMSNEVRTAPVGLYSFMGEFVYDWNLVLAMGVLMGVPLTIVFLYLQRYVVQGLTAGATKG